MSEISDEKIARFVQNGDKEAFGILVKRYESKLTRYAKKFLLNYEDVKDLVQEVFLKAFVNIQSFDYRRKFSPWLYRIAHNVFVNAIKKQKRNPLSFFDLDVFLPHFYHEKAETNIVKDFDARYLKDILDKSLDKLDFKYREPLLLYYFEEMSYREIAEVMHIPISTVGVRLNRGKELLREIYNKLNYGKENA